MGTPREASVANSGNVLFRYRGGESCFAASVRSPGYLAKSASTARGARRELYAQV
jgi:hypothetical protein